MVVMFNSDFSSNLLTVNKKQISYIEKKVASCMFRINIISQYYLGFSR